MAARRTSATAESPIMALGTPSEGGRSGRGKEGREKETFMCQFPGCGQAYSRMEYLKRHQRKHQDDRPFQCKDCTKAFARSDVLLRHRRRCHPTPPPVDRSTQSPPPFIRPGVPVSSSRHDPREASPPRARGRKHPREQDDDQGHSRSRADHEYDDEDDGDEHRYGENSRYARDGRASGNNGGNGYASYYGASNSDDHPNYSSHLMPYASSSAYHSLSDPNHLEDASVLLSMAYPGGVPSGEQPEQQRDLPEWASNPTINLIMENAVSKDGGDRAGDTVSRHGSASSGGGGNSNGPVTNGSGGADDHASSADIDPRLQGVAGDANEGGFLNAMSWLSGMGGEGVLDKTGLTPEGTRGWTPSGASPFQLCNLFSPSELGRSSFENVTSSSDNADAQRASTPDILGILEQIAMYEVPQTAGNPNPERPILRVDHGYLTERAGMEFDKGSPFYIPADRFAGCYQIPHWALPPLRTLSLMACRTFHTVLNHFSFVHLPTFKLINTTSCLAFAICTVGGIRTGHSTLSDNILWPVGGPEDSRLSLKPKALDGPVVPDQSWESLYEENWYNCKDILKRQEAWNVVGWNSGPIVRSEKTNMLVKSFSLAKGVLMTEYNVALLQALILYHAPNFLSETESERILANMFLGTIVNITRQIGFFTPNTDHFQQKIQTPVEPFTPNDLDRCWRQWIQLETRRRTAYLVYLLDTISALESNIPCILASHEAADVPLPAPDTLWKAPNAQQWLMAVKKYRPITLDEAMRRTFFLPTYGSFDTLHEKADTRYYNLLNESDYGPFARTVMVVALLRGVIDIGEGKRDRGDWSDLTDMWVGCSWLRPGKKMLAQDGTDLGNITRADLRGRFRLALTKWREGWDSDYLCSSPCNGTGRAATGGVSPQSNDSPQSEPEIPKDTLNYCEDALPFYWLSQALLNILDRNPSLPPGQNAFSDVRYGDMLKSARTFTRTGEGVPGQICNLSASHARRSRHPSVAVGEVGEQGKNHTPRQGQGQDYGSVQGSGELNGRLPTPTSSGTGLSSGGAETTVSGASAKHNSNPNGTHQGTDADANADLSSLTGVLSDSTLMGVLATLGSGTGDMGAQLGMGDLEAAFAGHTAGPGQRQERESQQDNRQQGGDRMKGGQVGGGIKGRGELAEHLGFIL